MDRRSAEEARRRGILAAERNRVLDVVPKVLLTVGGERTYRAVGRSVEGAEHPAVVWTVGDSSVVSLRVLDGRQVAARGLRQGRTLLEARVPGVPDAYARHEIMVGPPPPPYTPPPPPDEVRHRGVVIRARVESEPGVPAGATRVRGVVTLENPTREPVTLQVGPCPVWLTGHGAGSHFDVTVHLEPPLWDQRALPRPCAVSPGRIILPPGGARTLESAPFHAHEVLGDSVEEGGYPVHAHIALDGRTRVVNAGVAGLRFGVARLSARVETSVRGGTLHGRATLVNETGRAVRVEYGACALVLEGYPTPARMGRPAWRAGGEYCASYLAIGSVPARGTFSPGEFSLRVPLKRVLSDSVPNGRYYLRGLLEVNGDTLAAPAGEAVLARRRAPLPAERTVSSVTYRARTGLLPGRPQRVRTTVRARLTGAGGALLRYARDCPVTLLAYRSEARRDAAPLSGAPDWRKPAACGPALLEYTRNRGESLHFTVEATAREILGDSLPPGRYHFAAVVRTEHGRVFLSAGEARIGR